MMDYLQINYSFLTNHCSIFISNFVMGGAFLTVSNRSPGIPLLGVRKFSWKTIINVMNKLPLQL